MTAIASYKEHVVCGMRPEEPRCVRGGADGPRGQGCVAVHGTFWSRRCSMVHSSKCLGGSGVLRRVGARAGQDVHQHSPPAMQLKR